MSDAHHLHLEKSENVENFKQFSTHPINCFVDGILTFCLQFGLLGALKFKLGDLKRMCFFNAIKTEQNFYLRLQMT